MRSQLQSIPGAYVSLLLSAMATTLGCTGGHGGGAGAAGGGGSGGGGNGGGTQADSAPPADLGADHSGSPDAAAPGRGSGGTGGPKGTRRFEKLVIDGRERIYDIFVPTCYDEATPIPLVFYFHSTAGGPTGYQNDKLPADSEKSCFIGLSPRGCYYKSRDLYVWCPDPGGEDDDTEFVEALTADVFARYNIDTKKVYTSGFSVGAYMSQVYGMDHANKLAGVAFMGGGYDDRPFKNFSMDRHRPAFFVRVNSGDSNTAGATKFVEKLRSLGWRDDEINAEIGKTSGGHEYRPEWTAAMWSYFSRFELP